MVVLLLASAVGVDARAARPRAVQDALQLSTSEVLVDMTVVDDDRRAVLDLKPEEIEVYENGVKQDITSFELVRIGSTPRETATVAPDDADALTRSPFRGVNLILVVIDRTSIEPSNLARVSRAAERFFNERLAINDLVAIYAVTNKLVLIQNFTNNRQRLVAGIRRATRTTAGGLLADPVEKTFIESRDALNPRAVDMLSSIVSNVDRAYDRLIEQIQARVIVRSLLALSRSYAEIPGRKSLVLYSEGFALATENEAPFESMIGVANRANMTIHAVNAAGLVVRDIPLQQNRRRRPLLEESDERMLVVGGESGMDRLLRPQTDDRDSALQRIASDTGGVFVRNTNDFGRGFQAIETDLRAYYAVTYSPSDTNVDGTYRRIEVRLSRKDVRVRARKGYFAIPGGSDGVLLPFERPLLAAVAAAKPNARPSDLPVFLKVEYFRLGSSWQVPILISTHAQGLVYSKKASTDPDERVFQLDAVALVRDDTNAVLFKLSRSSSYRVDEARLAEFQESTIPLGEFAQPLVLQPGHYSILIGLRDPNSDRITVAERTITLPEIPREGAPSLSSLVLGKQIQTLSEPGQRSGVRDPFLLNTTTRIVPNPSGKFLKSNGDRLIALVRLQSVPGTRFEARLQFFVDDRVVLSTPLTLLAATDSQGETSYAPVITLDSLQPGQYRAQVAVYLPDSPKPLASTMTILTIES